MHFVSLEEGRQDIGKLVISSKGTNLSGQQVYDILLKKYHFQLEMVAGSYCLAMFTISDGKEAYEQLAKALLEIDGIMELTDGSERSDIAVQPRSNENVSCIPLFQAWDMEWEEIPLCHAVGRKIGEFVNLYPPGVPLLVPGETLLEGHVTQLMTYLKQGLTVQGVSGQEPYEVKVLKEIE